MPSDTGTSGLNPSDQAAARASVAPTDLKRLESGLDALETPRTEQRKFSAFLFTLLSPIIAIVAILLIWQVVIWLQWQPSYIIPSPSDVWTALGKQVEAEILWQATFNSISRAIKGFILALIIATPIGVALGLNRTLRSIFGPILTGLQQLPSVAWVPAAIIWFGLSDATIYTVVLLGAVPSIANGLISGIDQIPSIILRAGQVLGARGLDRVRHIVLPAAWPGYLAGLEQGWAFAWRSLMAAELIAVSPALGPGLGQMLDNGRSLGDMALIIGSIFMILAVGVLVERIVFAPLRRRTLMNRGLLR
ncbi:MAG: ABC transporter permease [Candidatus Nanopelagicales bacterium]|nr:ABC transporter permease [Candidatus Nanopelagicales bacterium]